MENVVLGVNDLHTINPAVAAEWHPTKNGSLTPTQVKEQSRKKVWWLGKCGHEWDMEVSKRSVRGQGCPICAGKRILIGYNDLASQNPLLAAEWHPTRNSQSPYEVSPKSSKKIWWICTEGHEWATRIQHRSNKSGCPVCSNKKTIAGYNDLASQNPLLAAEWHPTRNSQSPYEVSPKSSKKIWWICTEGHEWEASLSNRTKNNGTGCPFCAGQRTLVGVNDLASQNELLAAEWHPTRNGELTTEEVSVNSGTKQWWLGDCGHEWQAAVASRNKGRKCPLCSNKKIKIGFNDLTTTHPKLASEWHPTKNGTKQPEEIIARGGGKYWWLGDCGHEWEAASYHRAAYGRGCPICSNHVVKAGFNDLATKNPKIAVEWHPTKNDELIATQFIVNSTKIIWWLGDCGHEWEATISSRTNGHGCHYCTGQKALKGVNDLATRNPELATEWHPTKNGSLTPNQVKEQSGKKVWWLGKCDHEWESVISSRSKGHGCNQCSKRVSKAEEKIREFLVNLDLNVESSNRKILKGKEIDLWIPERRIGIEFNGLYWHTELAGKDNSYHYNKWRICKNQGISLIQIWEDDWTLHSEIIMKSLARQLGVAKNEPVVRNAKVAPIAEQQAEEFLTENHLQGFAPGSYYLGLIEVGDTETLQTVMVLDNQLDGEGQSLEIIRYASIANVTDDFSKLLSGAINEYAPESITVTADHCEGDGRLYTDNDFMAEKELPPDYMYVVRMERRHRSDYSLERVRDDPTLVWEEGLTEMELADLNGLNRIWDAGKTLYRLYV